MAAGFPAQLSKGRVTAGVRAPQIPDAAALWAAPRAGGIHGIEFTRTAPGLAAHLTTGPASRNSSRPALLPAGRGRPPSGPLPRRGPARVMSPARSAPPAGPPGSPSR
ncbi:hypothetical protein GCM10010340_28890 [Streptomyces griseoloalbus]|nr:hypothetical protein GCM10010340_28890 [Streptomyces albaduncus]